MDRLRCDKWEGTERKGFLCGHFRDLIGRGSEDRRERIG